MTTLTEAIARLSTIESLAGTRPAVESLAEIRSLALEFSAAATKTNAILYSGLLDATTPAYEVAGKLATQLDLAIIDKTPRGELPKLEDFGKTVERVSVEHQIRCCRQFFYLERQWFFVWRRVLP
jgi:hypothetical protein